ncbi:MAG: LysM peptidoglycan-binding domain-containing M23 family metallopeptidase [Myxococcota bacterium]
MASLAKTSQERSPNKDVPERIHVVEAGENLWRISLRYGTTVSELQRQNGLDNVTQLYVGQRLRITSGSTPASPPSRSVLRLNQGPPHSASSHRLTWPVSGKVTRYGTRWGNAHDGIDIARAARGSRVCGGGQELFSARHGGYGNIVVVKHNDGLVTVYAHITRSIWCARAKGQTAGN